MADSENSPPAGEDKDSLAEIKHLQIEARRVAAEWIVMLESIAAGLERLARLPEAVLLRNQLETLRGLVLKALESAEGFDEIIGSSANG
jgi:hypothetical protein